MRIYLSKRIFMNEADASPGNGAPAAPPAPSEPPAQPAAPALDVETLVARIAKMVDEKIDTKQNAAFAKLRKDGLLGKDKPSSESTATPAPQSPPAAAPTSMGLSAADVQAIVDRTTAITRVQVENKLSDAQVKRMRSALETEKPEDVSTWVSTYLTDMGLVRTAESNPATPTSQPQPTAAPISDKGSPAPGGAVNWEREFAENPVGMSPAARALMDAKHGAEKARKMRVEAGQAQMARMKVALK